MPLSSSDTAADPQILKLKDVMPYKPPGPPPKTGKHQYVYIALAPANGTSKELELVKPGDRQHWGYEGERQGLREWAGEMGLVPVGESLLFSDYRSCGHLADSRGSSGELHLCAECGAVK